MLSIVGDNCNRLLIIAGQHTDHGWMTLGLKGNTITDLELQHSAVRTHLVYEAKALHDSMVEVDQFRLSEFVNIDFHVTASPIRIILYHDPLWISLN